MRFSQSESDFLYLIALLFYFIYWGWIVFGPLGVILLALHATKVLHCSYAWPLLCLVLAGLSLAARFVVVLMF